MFKRPGKLFPLRRNSLGAELIQPVARAGADQSYTQYADWGHGIGILCHTEWANADAHQKFTEEYLCAELFQKHFTIQLSM